MDIFEPVDWGICRSFNFVFDDFCWKKCTANCCKSEVPGAEFKFIKNPGTWVLYLPDEYRFLKEQRGGVICPNSATQFRNLGLELKNGVNIEAVWRHCTCEGLCEQPAKPLMCSLVPFLPVMDMDGNVTDVSFLSIFDVTIASMGFAHRCSVDAKIETYKRRWMNEPNLIAPLTHPYILFYVMAANLFYDNYREMLVNNPKLAGKEGTKFWNAWEIEFLLGRLCDKNKLIISLSDLYEKFEKRYLGFSL